MIPSTRHLQAFVAVSRNLSFRSAAGELLLTQPAVSQSIRELEQGVGVKLLHRTTRSVALTEAGKLFLPVAERVLGDLEAAVEGLGDMASGQRGRAAIAALPSVASRVLPPLVADFTRQYPRLRVVIRDALAHEILDLVRSGAVDLGVSVEPRVETGLEFSPLTRDKMVALLPTDHPLGAAATIEWTQLAEYPFIAMAPGTSVRGLTDAVFAGIGRSLVPDYEVTYLSTATALVSSGLGLCALPSLAAPGVENTALMQRPLVAPVTERTVGLLTRINRTPPPGAEHLANFLMDRLSE